MNKLNRMLDFVEDNWKTVGLIAAAVVVVAIVTWAAN